MDKGMRLVTIPGSPPDLSNLPSGCAFADRCAMAQAACLESAPQAQTLAQGHEVRCFRA
jgi:peptide/nickel transport system ATP-binding protein